MERQAVLQVAMSGLWELIPRVARMKGPGESEPTGCAEGLSAL